MLNGDFTSPTYYQNVTGSTNYFNFRYPIYPPNPFPQFLNLTSIRQSLHVGGILYAEYNSSVETALLNDWMQSVVGYMPTLMNNYKVMIYSGQDDVILAGPMTELLIDTIEWKHAIKYAFAKKKLWTVENAPMTPAGYVRQVDNFVQAIVRNAGHMVPTDQPLVAFELIDRFVQGRPF